MVIKYKHQNNRNFVSEKKVFNKIRIILKNWDKFKCLSPRLQRVLTLRYDLKNNRGNFLSYREVAKRFKMNRKTIYDFEKKAMKFLNNGL